jgi:cytoskeleton protein RodZ
MVAEYSSACAGGLSRASCGGEEIVMGVGRRLRQAREARGLSIGEVAVLTKIPTRQLAALEAEEYEKLPGGIFVRGHVRAAAKVVGLDPTELVEHFQEEQAPPSVVFATAPDEEELGPRIRMASEPTPPQRRAGPFLALLVLLLSIVLVLVWFGRGRDVPPASRDDRAKPPAAATHTPARAPASQPPRRAV